MNWFKKARLDASKDRPVLKDIRALFHDNIGVSINELRLIQNDPNYLAKPAAYAKIIQYFNNDKLLKHVCHLCPISTTLKKIHDNQNQESSDVSKYNKDINKLNSIKKLAKKRKRKNFIFQNARFRHSLRSNRYNTIEYVSMMTAIPIKTISKMEKGDYLIDDFEEADILLKTYLDPTLNRKICGLCPASHAATKVIKGKNKRLVQLLGTYSHKMASI